MSTGQCLWNHTLGFWPSLVNDFGLSSLGAIDFFSNAKFVANVWLRCLMTAHEDEFQTARQLTPEFPTLGYMYDTRVLWFTVIALREHPREELNCRPKYVL